MTPSNCTIISAFAKSADANGIICTDYTSPTSGEWGVNMRTATDPFSPIQNSKQKFEIAYIERG